MLDSFLQTSRLLIEECLRRGIAVEVPYLGSSLLHVQKSDGTWERSFSSSVSTMSVAAANLAENKYATHVALSDAGLPVLPTQKIDQSSDLDEVYGMFGKDKSLVVKPLDGAHGDGITIGIQSKLAFTEAVAVARASGTKASVIVQQQYERPVDVRILCIDNVFVSAVLRIPARVRGDGVHTTEELIEAENQKPDRGVRYIARLSTINGELAAGYLGDAMHTVPADGQWVTVMAMANYGVGGETEVITCDIPEWLQRMAEKASRAIGLPLCGVDFLLHKNPSIHDTQSDLNPAITELNSGPSLHIHEHPTNNEGDKVATIVIDYLLSRP